MGLIFSGYGVSNARPLPFCEVPRLTLLYLPLSTSSAAIQLRAHDRYRLQDELRLSGADLLPGLRVDFIG